MIIPHRAYTKKAVLSGNIIQVYEYDNPVLIGIKARNKKGRSSKAKDEESKKNYKRQSYYRARSKITRLINANHNRYPGYRSKFVTFTFRDNITDLKYAWKEWDRFLKRLRRYVGYTLHYVVVVEFQKRGAVHFHAIFFDLPYVSVHTLAGIWHDGFIKINAIDNISNVGSYVAKYMSKNIDDDRLIGVKCYSCSQGLFKPLEVINSEADEVESFLSLDDLKFERDFVNEYNTVHYRQYEDKTSLYSLYLHRRELISDRYHIRC